MTHALTMQNFMFFCFTMLLSLTLVDNVFASVPPDWHIGFQNPSTTLMEEIKDFYNLVIYMMYGVVAFVICLIGYISVRYEAKNNPIPSKFSENVMLEVFWTSVPIVILAIMAFPSFALLRKMNTVPDSDLTIKVVGYQWYWHYEYPDHDGFGFDSYIIRDKDLKAGQYRLLEVDNRVIVPVNKVVRFLITGGDVIHSFAIPSAGIKTDAVPGRVNETWAKFKETGVYYGQCSELCGADHGFMPIAIEVVSEDSFNKWVREAKVQFH